MAMRINIFTSIDDAAETWKEAEAEGICSGFQSFSWLSTWQETIGQFERVAPHIVQLVDESGLTLMLLPLGIRCRFGLRTLRFLGGRLTDYNAPILRADFVLGGGVAVWVELWDRILRALPPVDIVRLERMPQSIEDLENPFARLPGVRPAMASFHAVLKDGFEEFRRSRSVTLRRDTQRKRRRLAELGNVSFHIADTPADAEAYLAVIARQKAKRQREMGESCILDIPAYRAFYTRMASEYCRSGFIQTSALRVGDEIVAGHWGMIYRGRFYWLMPAYAGKHWAKYSTGRILLDHLIEWSFAQHFRTFDFTIGDEAYKHQWCDGKVPLFELEQPRTYKGILPALTSRLIARTRERVRQCPRLLGHAKRARRLVLNSQAVGRALVEKLRRG
jgi:CelD/BcsL family acetyltransferase involved in cellulose biosynthesis